jgi:hypothetical protein
LDSPVPNPPPVPSDLPPPSLVTPDGALTRSLLVWGWGQVAARDRRGWLLMPLQVVALGGLAAVAPRLAAGSGISALFVAGSAVLFAWAAVALHAYRTARTRRARLDLSPSGRGAVTILWLAPLVIVCSSALWAVAGRAADPGSALDAYVRDWRAGDAAGAREWLVGAPPAATIADAWERQSTSLRNELVRLSPQLGDDTSVDPDRPLDGVRWVQGEAGAAGSETVLLEVARSDNEQGLLFGLIPVTSQKTVTVARLGTVELRAEPVLGPWVEWRIARVEVGGILLGG